MKTLCTENLSKKYGTVMAADSISLRVEEGEIYGFLGLNGAGKTTTIRMLLGMIKPDSGTACIMNEKIGLSRGPWRDVGYMVEAPSAYPNLTVIENLHLVYRMRKLTDRSLLDRSLEWLQLGRYANTQARFLSMGNAQRLGLAKALLHRPRILILDEPTNGLDPAGIVEIRALLRDLAHNQGVTIFISSHILNEMSRVANRIGIIHEGKLIHEAKEAQLKSSAQKKMLVDTIDNKKAIAVLNEQGIHAIVDEHNNIEIRDTVVLVRPEIIASLLVNNNVPPKMIKIEEEDLETYFLRIIRNSAS